MTVNDGVDVWRVWLDQPAAVVDNLARHLSADERERVARGRFSEVAARFIVGRSSLRMILASYLDGVGPSGLAFTYGPRGKPALVAGGAAPTLRFNVAHSHELALVSVTRAGDVGVDVERERPLDDLEAIVARYFSPWENAALRGLPKPARTPAFFRCWTRKEAFIKATGEGLTRALDTFSVSLDTGEPARFVSIGEDPGETARWSMFDLAPAPGYAAALVVEGRVCPPTWRRLGGDHAQETP